jgi:hypothetical protein
MVEFMKKVSNESATRCHLCFYGDISSGIQGFISIVLEFLSQVP